ncbi:MAG: alpha-2-macroglobulin family protein [Candidatus Korobacteraceae bacterium]
MRVLRNLIDLRQKFAVYTCGKTALAVLVLAVVLCAAFPAPGQEKSIYFSVSTNRAFQPGEKPQVRLFARGVDVLEFRVYHIRDPLAFFQKLDNVHSFGGAQPSPRERVDERTWLERFHDWKHRWWVRLRDFFRRQFSADARAEIRQLNSERVRKSRISGAAGFADVPLLNQQQLVARWRVELPPKYISEASDLPLESLDPGAYLLEVTDGRYKAYTVLLVSRMALVTKGAPGQLVAFTTDRQTGEPFAGSTITVWRKKAVAAQFKTDGQGLGEARISLPAREAGEEGASFSEGGEWVLARNGAEVAIVAPYSLSLSSEPGADWLGNVYTDRPVYRPGHTVQFKAILRRRDGDRLLLPQEREVDVVIQDATNNAVLRRRYTLSAFGTVNGTLQLPATAALGYYSIQVGNVRGQAFGSFQVEEYKKPEYFVKVTPEKTRVLQGETLKAVVEARYFFGEPVANAKVTYVVHTQRAYFWGEDESADDDSSSDDESDRYFMGEQILEQQGKLDANGRLVVSIPAKVEDKRRIDLNYRIEARVTDASNREIAGHNAFLATYGSYRLQVSAQSFVFQQGQSPKFTVQAIDYNNKPIQTTVRVELLRHKYGAQDVSLEAGELKTGADGNAVASFSLKDPGSYIVRATSRTPENRDVTGSTWVWVAGKGEQFWGGGGARIQIVPDKKSYRIGETAHVLVATGVPQAVMLVTTEGRSVLSKQIVRTSEPSVTVDVPVTSESQPNVFVGVVFLRDNQFYEGKKSLNVPPVEQRLNIEIVPAKAQFLPGEPAIYQLTAKDANGKPVQAELSMGVVDDAIYSVEPDHSGDIVKAFYQRRYYSVNTENSLAFYFSGQAGARTLQLAAIGAGSRKSALAQVKDMVQPKVRKAFPDTAFWAPDVKTDAAGRATVKFAFPDSLTTWRTTVRAVTMDTKAGWAINRVLVRKNLIVRLAVPRFFRQGDEVTVSAIVHNYLDSAKSARVSLDASGVSITEGATREVTVPSRGDAKLDWKLRAPGGSSAVLTAKALTNEESDALEFTLPIIPFGVKQAIPASGVIAEKSGASKAAIDFPAVAQAASRAIEIELSPSITGGILDALEYLTSFPYGCTEQTMSSLLPNVIVAKTLQELKLPNKVAPALLRSQVNAGLQRLYEYQHQDGGWGWWKEDDSMVFMTAYVVSGLAQAREAGYPVQTYRLNRGKDFLKRTLQEHPNMIADLRAYVVLALAENGERDRGLLDSVWERKGKLSSQGLAFAGLAMQLAGDARAGEAATILRGSAKAEGDAVYWPAKSDSLLEIETDTSAEATAYAVKLLSRTSPEDPLMPKAVQWMMRHRSEGFYWSTTKQTAMVLYGMLDYLKVSKELEASFDAEVLAGGKSVLKRHFGAQDATSGASAKLRLAGDQAGAANQLEIRKSGTGRLYWSARGDYYSTDKKLYSSGSFTLNIARDYFRLAKGAAGEKIVYDLDPLRGAVESGDILAVHVTVSGGKWKYLIIEDPIPAGTEFIQQEQLYELREKPPWWKSWYLRREFHDDRAAIFQTYFDQQRQYVYLLKVVNAGRFRISPASVQPMYQPQVLATTDPSSLEVK